jgi:hypothetical protein
MVEVGVMLLAMVEVDVMGIAMVEVGVMEVALKANTWRPFSGCIGL